MPESSIDLYVSPAGDDAWSGWHPDPTGIPIRPGTAATGRSRPWRRRSMRCGSGVVPGRPAARRCGCAAGATSGNRNP